PQVLVDDGLLGRGDPPFSLPSVDPGCDAVLEIFGIGDHFDLARFAQSAQAFDRRGQLHAVVGGVRLAAPQLLLVRTVPENRRPPARTGISEAGAIGDELYFFQWANTGSE